VNGWDVSALLESGFFVEDLGDGRTAFQSPDLELGESIESSLVLEVYGAEVLTINGPTPNVALYAEPSFDLTIRAVGNSSENAIGEQLELANDDEITLYWSDLVEGRPIGYFNSVFNILENDASGVQLVSYIKQDEIEYADNGNTLEVGIVSEAGPTGLIYAQGLSLGAANTEDGGVYSQAYEYTVVDSSGNYDSATLTLNFVNEQLPIVGGPFINLDYSNPDTLVKTVQIQDTTTLTFDDEFLVNHLIDLNNLDSFNVGSNFDLVVEAIGGDPDDASPYGLGLSVENVRLNDLSGVLIDSGNGSYTYDPTVGADLDPGEREEGYVVFDVLSEDGSFSEAAFSLSIVSDDPLVP
jgi:hypothetical protein